MPDSNIPLMAHLMRRAGFGANRDELERYAEKGYEATVEELLHPENAPPALDDLDLLGRYHAGIYSLMLLPSAQTYYIHRMVHTRRPLEEKLGLFWHGVFATGYTKLNQPKQILRQIDMFRRYGLGSFRDLLTQLAKDPAMIFWLDNKDNHRYEPNENWGRELLELFSMGVGNYTEQDVFEASRAFTGWTMRNANLHTARVAQDSVEPYARLDWQFEYNEDDHDDTDKTFLGHTGNFNGDDIVDIVCRQEATARFLSRHLYNFFVADEPQVPAWETVPPRDPQAIQTLMAEYFRSDYDIRCILRVLFSSDFFKEAAFQKVKSPAELVAGAVRMAGTDALPQVDDVANAAATGDMGQDLLDPPSVEGWHTGVEWLNTGSLVSRINFASKQFANVEKPGVRAIIERIRAANPSSPQELVDLCLDHMGPVLVNDDTKREMIEQAGYPGPLDSTEKIVSLFQLIVAAREFQLA